MNKNPGSDKEMSDSLKDKAKTLQELIEKYLDFGSLKLTALQQDNWNLKENPNLVLLSDAQAHEEQLQKEIAIQIERVKDPLQTKIEALQLAILSIYKPEIAILEKKHEELKQKIREVIEYFKAYPYYPSVIEKLEELLK